VERAEEAEHTRCEAEEHRFRCEAEAHCCVEAEARLCTQEDTSLRTELKERRRPEIDVRALEDPVLYQFLVYELKWQMLRTGTVGIPAFESKRMPWPVLGGVDGLKSDAHFTADTIEAFIPHPGRPGCERKTARSRIRAEMLRWHPDEFKNGALKFVLKAERKQAAAPHRSSFFVISFVACHFIVTLAYWPHYAGCTFAIATCFSLRFLISY
jgi:hypothetical protein